MKRISIIVLLFFAVSCSSPVEKYIKKDFARVVREDALDEEVQDEIDRLVALFEDLADKANLDAKQARELKAKADKWEKEIYSRLESYKRTGHYSYIINISNEADECDAMHVRANSLARKAKPYTNHKDKQIMRVVQYLCNVDAKALMNSTDLVRNDSITVEFIFDKVFGTPSMMANPSEEELEDLAVAYMTNYFLDTPTPTVLAYKFQKKDDRWYITLSDDTQYFLSAIKYGKGDYSYQYVETDDPFQYSPSTSSKAQIHTKVNSGDIDKFLDKYEKFATTFVKEYKKLYSESMSEDLFVLEDFEELMDQADEFEEECEKFDGNMTPKQLERYTQITLKMTNVLAE